LPSAWLPRDVPEERRAGPGDAADETTRPYEAEEILAAPVPVELCTSKYDYAGILITTADESRTLLSTAVFDGLNSAGLSVGSLNADGSRYQRTFDATKTKKV